MSQRVSHVADPSGVSGQIAVGSLGRSWGLQAGHSGVSGQIIVGSLGRS